MDAAYLLIILVTFTCKNNHIILLRVLERVFDGVAPILDDDVRIFFHAGHDLFYYSIWILKTGIIRCDYGKICQCLLFPPRFTAIPLKNYV